MKKISFRITILIFFCFAGDVFAMSIFSKNVMCSEVVGKVTLNGIPIKDAEIERYFRWSWNDKKEVDQTITDSDGNFKLPLIEKSPGTSGLIPHEPVIFQQISIKYKGEEYIAWQHTKHNYEKNGELKGKPLSLICELSKSPEGNDVYAGICTIKD